MKDVKIANKDLIMRGIVISNNEDGDIQIQKIDDTKFYEEELGIDHIPQLESDDDATNVIRGLVVDKYIDIIKKGIASGDTTVLSAFLYGEFVSINSLTEKELFVEGIKLGLF